MEVMGTATHALLFSMIKALQMTFQDSYIAEDSYIAALVDDDNTPILTHSKQVPIDHVGIHKYMVPSRLSQGDIYATKILVHSNNELKDYLSNWKFRNYLKTEQISVEINHLSTAVPYNVGFVEQVTSTRDTTILHKARIDQLLPPNAPKFQIILQCAFSNEIKNTFWVMIQSARQDAEYMICYLTLKMKTNWCFFLGQDM
jgi:hypothetical protein